MSPLYRLKISFLILSILPFYSCTKPKVEPSLRIQYLHEGWTVRSDADTVACPAIVPGNSYHDYLQAGRIPDPFYADNEKKLQWMDETNWHYSLTFEVDSTLLKAEMVKLVFEGLDTYAEITFNDSLLGATNNMYRKYYFSVEQLIRPGKNHLQITFRNPLEINQQKAAELPYSLPDSRVFTRKAPYQFGWDWGPELITAGIWKPVYLEAANGFVVRNLQLQTVEIGDGFATLKAFIEIESFHHQEIKLALSQAETSVSESFTAKLNPGIQRVEHIFQVQNPELWWPAGYGEPHLYDFKLQAKTSQVISSQSLSYGIRTVELVQESDSIGKSFYVKVNSIPIFAKGANYIPQDNLLNRVDSARHKSLFQRVTDAHMNMLRIWGGGIYEDDYFYDLADQHGILIWQDFMYACAMYPGDSAFLNNAAIEAEQQIKRISKHSSLALWCGNNEVDNGWKDWGWQKQYTYSASDSARIYQDYLALFEAILPKLVHQFAPGISYHPSSPTHGWGHPEALTHGDSHYWGIWWGMENFENYRYKTGRFMSEYGFQGFPNEQILKEYIPEKNLHLYDSVLLVHQKHPTGNQTIEAYQEKYMPRPRNFSEQVYISQVLQAYGMEAGIRFHRMQKPVCMGTLYWQLNDCWPVISWSGLDYEYHPKALHYRVAESFRDIMPWAKEAEDEVIIGINSDINQEVTGKLTVTLIDFQGEKKLICDSIIHLKPLSNGDYYHFNYAEYPVNPVRDALVLEFKLDGEKIYQDIHYFQRPRNLILSPVDDKIELSIQEDSIFITSSVLVKSLYLYSDAKPFEASENYLDVIPGETLKVSINRKDLEAKELSYRCLNQFAD